MKMGPGTGVRNFSGVKAVRCLPMLAVLMLSGCGTMAFTPTEYPLRNGLVTPMPVVGQVQINNAQLETGPVIVYSYGGTKLSSDLYTITQVMVDQATKELAKAGKPTAGAPKTIELKVNSLVSTYSVFHWNSHLSFEARLGNGQVLSMGVPHTSGVLIQDLNGCIAESVMKLLNDPRVRSYLAQ